MRRSWLLPPTSPVLLQATRLASLHDPIPAPLQTAIRAPLHDPIPAPLQTATRAPLHDPIPAPLQTATRAPLHDPIPAPLQTAIRSPLQTHRQWRCPWPIHSIGVVTFVLFVGCMIVPILAEADFVGDNKAANMQTLAQIRSGLAGGQDRRRNNVENQQRVAEWQRKDEQRQRDVQLEQESQRKQRDAQLEQESQQKQRDAQLEQESQQKQRDAQLEQESQQKQRDAQLEQESQQKQRDAQLEQERQQKQRDAQLEQERQRNQLHELANGVEVAIEKKVEEVKSQQKQGAVLGGDINNSQNNNIQHGAVLGGDNNNSQNNNIQHGAVLGGNDNSRNNNIQEKGEAIQIDYSAGNKVTRDHEVGNQQSHILGHNLPVVEKNNDQREDTLPQGGKPGYDGNNDKPVKHEKSSWEFGKFGVPQVTGNSSKSQIVDADIKYNLEPHVGFPPVANSSSNTNVGQNDGNNRDKNGQNNILNSGISNNKKEVDSLELPAKKEKVDVGFQWQGHGPVKEVDSQQKQQQDGVNNNVLQHQQEIPQHQEEIPQHQQQIPQHQQQILQQQQQIPQQLPVDTGGIDIRWDWEDFSIMLNSYGAAEMKVRRAPHATTGEPWPMPQYYSKKDNKIFRLDKDFSFIPVGVKCDVLEEALVRHLQRTLRGSVEDMYDNLQHADGTPIEDPTLRYGRDQFLKAPVITRVEVKVKKPCSKYPALESDESYDLVIKKKKAYIWANEVWGALRGLETFGHLVWIGTDDSLYIKETVISDYPRFPHRGLLVDTSRHFLFKEIILDIIESMEMNKMNVLHWHIVDDQSFPYESKAYPELSRKGAFHPTYVYSLEDIAEIIEYARLRGIRVMPEFDTPGHTYAWGFSRPELLTQCYTGNIPVKGYFGPIDPSKNSTYRFLQTLFQEIVEVFKDQYLHLGGDEVPLGCWQSNPEVLAFAHELAKIPRPPQQASQFPGNGGFSMWSDEIRGVYEYYENRLISIVSEAGQKKKKAVKYVMWQEVMNNNLQLPNDTIIQVWMGDMGDVYRATSMGYQVLYSTCWYMDHIEYGTKWTKYYNCDPVDQSFGYHIDEKKVLGGEAAFWSEYFTNENLLPLMWPRASAAAERLWSNKDLKNLDKAAARLTEHRCRMIKRGINVGEINGPGYCLHPPPKRRLLNETVTCKGNNCTHIIKENIQVFVSQRGSLLAECGRVLTSVDGNVFIVLILICIGIIALYTLSKSPYRWQRFRNCKNRNVLFVFILVLVFYFLCSTTIWMHVFDFTSFYRKTQHKDNTSGSDGNKVDHPDNTKTASS